MDKTLSSRQLCGRKRDRDCLDPALLVLDARSLVKRSDLVFLSLAHGVVMEEGGTESVQRRPTTREVVPGEQRVHDCGVRWMQGFETQSSIHGQRIVDKVSLAMRLVLQDNLRS